MRKLLIKSPKFRLTGTAVLILCSLWIFSAYVIFGDRALELRKVRIQTVNLSVIYSNHVYKTFSLIEKTLNSIKSSEKLIHNSKDLHEDLIRIVETNPDLFNLISVIDSKGYVSVLSKQENEKTFSGDRDFFIYHRFNSDESLHIGHPIVGRVTGKWYIPMSIRLNDANGNFSGVLLASINPYYFSEIIRGVDLGKDSMIYLSCKEGIVYSGIFNGYELHLDKRAQKYVIDNKNPEKAYSIISAQTSLDNIKRIISFSPVMYKNMFVAVAISKKEALSRWQMRSLGLIAVQIIFSVMIIIAFSNMSKAVSQKKTSEEKLRISEERLRYAFAAASDGLWDINLITREVYYSPHFYKMLEYEDGEFEASFESWLNLLHPLDKITAEEKFYSYIEGKLQNYCSEFRLKSKTNKWKWILSRGSIVEKNENGPVRIVGTHVDITERKNYQEALQRSEENYRVTLDSIGDAVIATDVNGNISKMNRIAETLTGWKSGEACGLMITDVMKIISIENGETIANPVFDVIAMRKRISISKDAVLISKDGKEYRISDSAALIYDDYKNVVGAVLVFRDVTEEYLLQEQLRQSQKLDAIGQLAGGIAHDFNNMLGGIIGGAELLSPKITPGSEEMEYLEMIIESAERASALASKLLSFSRRESVVLNPVDIHQIIRDALSILKNTIDKRIVIETDFRSDESIVLGETVQLQNAFLNLGINSWQAMPDGGRLHISTSLQNIEHEAGSENIQALIPGKYIRIEIEDTGIGISENNISHIFEPFFTTKEQGKGTGLGLSAVYGTVKRYGGLISVKSELGKGTTFSIHLPLSHERETDLIKKEHPVYKGNGLILIAEDETAIRNVEEKIITECGYDCISAKNGKEAFELYTRKSSEIILVILDMIMPEMNGKDCFFEIKKINPDARIILCSGYSREEDVELLKENGLSAYIKKPFKKDDFCNIIYEIIASSV
ncbi:MAG TPA: PAS domain S-box protein [Spirochaetota bacterium]|nr:PAS domain S-box protein [Spirochaetota bacterium]HOR45225.1 PAS domain S-box protein [Spirochaetota bacterium]HOU83605.1 PAS domain S-box protein [Spirochaetota bacterium]HPK56814.1 PAS domain S-box protein [Spirochaetota bacterium]HQE58454.1 PAS domain S-box protein [Spirochaetota bacterium]